MTPFTLFLAFNILERVLISGDQRCGKIQLLNATMGPGSWFGEGTDVSTGMLIVGFGQVYFFTAFVIFAGMLLNEIGYLTWALTPLGIGLVLYWLLGDLDLVDDLMFPLVAAALVFIVGSVSLLIAVNIVEWGLNLR